jgi:predicted O-linked N-acetylglucosamine transferase (SPINDLY family)
VTYPYGGAWERNNPRQLFEARVRADLATQGVDPDRVKFLQPLNSRGNVKAVLALADIYLDSFPYGGANTIIDPLELGVPAIAMRGGFQRSQQGAAILDDLGLPDLAAKDAREYCDLAVFLGTKPVLRAAIAEQVRRRMRDRPRFLDAADHAAQIGAILHALVRPMPEGSGV